MAERVRRRTSKWDVAAEHHAGTESIRHESTLPAEEDESCRLTELNHTNHDCRQPLGHYETKPCLSTNVDGSEIDQSANQSGQVKNNNIIISDDLCKKSQYSKQFDLEGDSKDCLKIQDQEHISQDRTMTEYAENQDKPLKVANAMSPGPDERRRHLSRDASPADGRGKSGRKRSRSRSLSYDSRSRSWSRSPSYASKQGFERWTDKGRMKGAADPCRDFAAGRCRRGGECRYLHEGGGWRQTNRHHDAGPTNERESRFERGRHIAYGSKENINSREKVNYSRDTLSRRHEDPYDDGWDNNKQHKGYRSNEICFDYTKGRCHRGTLCRYIHQDASSDDRWSVRDESRGRFVDRRDGGASFGHRLERQRVSDVPCKYFLEGRCRHGEGCRFSHHARPLNNPENRSHDIQHHLASVGNSTLAKASEQHDQTTQFGITNHLLAGGENELRVSDAQPLDYNDFTKRSLCNRPATLNQDSTLPSEQKTTEQKATEEFSATVNTEVDHEGEKQADFAHNPLSTTTIANQNVDHKEQNQVAPQLMSAQNFASNSPVGQFAPLLPLNGQMQAMHSFPQSGQSQLATLHKPSDAHYFNASMQNQSAHLPHYELNQQKLDYGGQVQQNLLLQLHGESNYNLTGQIQQNLSLIHNAPSQPDFTIGGHIQQSLSSHIGNSHQNIAAGDVQQTLPQNVQMQEPSVPLLISNGQRQSLAPQPPSNPQSFKSDERNCQLTSKNNSTQQPIGSGEGQPQGGVDSSEVKSTVFTPDNPIIHKVVTTEQAAKIIDLSASLAQFFGTAALNSQSTAGMTPQALINSGSHGSYVDDVAPTPTEVGGSQTNLNHSAPSAVATSEEKPHQQIHVMEQIKQGEDASAKEVEKNETLQNKEQLLQSQNGGDAEDMKDGDSKKIKEAKGVRMFKCALVEFVKDILKPTWKEGQLSKEAHKTIVKKVVDKVSGSLQGPNVPQTQEKIDLYLSNAKPKLSKLVQAYVEKYIKS